MHRLLPFILYALISFSTGVLLSYWLDLVVSILIAQSLLFLTCFGHLSIVVLRSGVHASYRLGRLEGFVIQCRREVLSGQVVDVASLQMAMNQVIENRQERNLESGDRGGNTTALLAMSDELKLLKQQIERLGGRGLASNDKDARTIEAAEPIVHLSAIRAALHQNRLDLALQPIVSLPQRKRRAYECFARLHAEDGKLIPAALQKTATQESELISAIDNILLLRCVHILRQLRNQGRRYQFFYNLSAHTLHDRLFLSEFTSFIAARPDLSCQLVFDTPQQAIARFQEQDWVCMRQLVAHGCRLAIDQVTEINFDGGMLNKSGVSFIKITAELLLNYAQTHGFQAARAIKRDLDDAGVDLVITHIEDEGTLRELLDFEIDYGQGYLFGAPRIIQREASSAPEGQSAAA